MTIKCYDKLPDEAVKIRTLVFVEEQGFKNEFDSIDEIAAHIVMLTAIIPLLWEDSSRQKTRANILSDGLP